MNYDGRSMKHCFLLFVIITLISFQNTGLTQVYNNLYFSQIKGRVKSTSTHFEDFDFTSMYFNHQRRTEISYTYSGNRYLEEEFIEGELINRTEFDHIGLNGFEKRIRKVRIA